MTRDYENVVIIDPTIGKDNIEKEITKIEELIKEHGGELTSTQKWGARKLAYPIRKLDTGFYVVFTFRAESEKVELFKKKLKLESGIIRYGIFKK
ncbi:MAG TPA: 30S ribosomal protein S6 [bacterium (Candidatus Stahlbacteria)]|nr:30S ribosomal protein S6 [Candidatus Stahlbacteria bacterium]